MARRPLRGAGRGRRRPADAPDLTERLQSLLLWVGLPLLALFLLAVSIDDLGPAYAARAGRGTYGEFHGAERRCHTTRYGESCDELWGEFTPEDGGPERYVRHVEPPEGFGVGGRVRALLPDGATDHVYRAEDTRVWIETTAVAVASAAALVVAAVLLVRRAA